MFLVLFLNSVNKPIKSREDFQLQRLLLYNKNGLNKSITGIKR